MTVNKVVISASSVLIFSLCVSAADPAALWLALEKPAFDPAKQAAVNNLALARDRIKITLADGALQFSQPLEGQVYGAAFRGRGSVEITPPNAVEAQQVRLHTGEDKLSMAFTEAVFVFADNTFQEVSGKVQWAGAGDPRLGELYLTRQKEKEEVGAELVPRLFKSLLSADRSRAAFFAADLKTDKKGWIHVRWDNLEPEEIKAGRWADYGAVKYYDDWLSFPAGNRTPMEAFRDPLAKEDFHIRGYKIDASVADNTELRATARVDLEYRAAGERVLLFLLDPNLRVESVTGAQGAALPFFQPRDPKDRAQSYGDYVAVVLPEPTAAGAKQSLEFKYAGKRVVRKVGNGNFFCQSFGWYPTRDNSFAARADFEINFRSPKKYTLVATGQKVSETVDGNLSITSWKSEMPLAVAGFAFGDYKVLKEKAGNVEIEIYANKQPDDTMSAIMHANEGGLTPMGETRAGVPLGSLTASSMAKPMAIEVGNNVRLFENYFGPFPYKTLAVTNIPFTYGQGWPGLLYLSMLTFLDSTQRHALGIKDQVGISDFFRAHETSHQWWGHRVSWKSYHDQWLSEGFAQFSGNLYVQYRQNFGEYMKRIRKDREDLLVKGEWGKSFESLGPVWMGTRLSSSSERSGYSEVVYNKGGLILHMIRMLFNDPTNKNPEHRFMAAMKEFCEKFHNQAASTEDFKEVIEKHMPPQLDLEGNQRLDWLFRQYVYGTGVPEYQFKSSVEAAGEGKWKVSGQFTQSGVPDGWMDTLPLYVQTGGRTIRVGLLSIRQKTGTLDFVLPVKPDKIILNHNEDTLALVKQ